jgi:hypothetical protein
MARTRSVQHRAAIVPEEEGAEPTRLGSQTLFRGLDVVEVALSVILRAQMSKSEYQFAASRRRSGTSLGGSWPTSASGALRNT